MILFLASASFIIYLLGSQISDLSSEWPLLKQQLTGLFHSFQDWLQNTFHVNVEKQTAYIDSTTDKVLSSSGTILEKTVLSISSILLLVVFMVIYTFFFCNTLCSYFKIVIYKTNYTKP